VENGASTEELVQQAPGVDTGAPAVQHLDDPAGIDFRQIEPAQDVTPVDPRYVDAEADDEDNIIFRGLE
jgi:hypothetical protein